MNEEVFRAYDIRGIYPLEINEDFAYLIGQSYGSYLQEKYNYNTCIVSHDNRLSSDSLTENLIQGIRESGCNVIYLGLTTTPMNYFARSIRKLPGIMVTASHNPKDDNGFKFSFTGMINARGEMIEDFKKYTQNKKFKIGFGSLIEEDIKEEYLIYLKRTIDLGKFNRKIVLDPGNGVVSTIVKDVFKDYQNVIYINDKSDGSFPNHHPDPAVKENMEQLSKAVLSNHADLGIGFDGDGDRIGIVMENGQMLPIEYFMIMNIENIYPKVNNKTFLYDIKCSKSVEDYLKSVGCNACCYRTGASYTEYKVHIDNIPFGCEYSGHVYFNDRDIECCSALYATLRFLEIMTSTDKKLSEIVSNYPKYYATEEIKITCDDSKKFAAVNKILAYAQEKKLNINNIDGVRITYDDGWVLVRASNTGPNLTFRVEATTQEMLSQRYNEYLELIKNILNKI